MLKILKDPTFTHTVFVAVPVDGGHEEQDMKVTYRLLKGETPTLQTQDEIEAFLRSVVVEMSDIEGEDGRALPWNDKLRDDLFSQPHIRVAVMAGYFRAVTKAAEGNSAGRGKRG